MRLTLIILIGLFSSVSSTIGQQLDDNNIQGFNKMLGKEKANALNAAVESFEQFLLINYSDHKTYAARSKAFLEQLYHYEDDIELVWALATENNRKVIEDFETTGMRREIWVYSYEDYEPKYNIHELLQPDGRDSVHEIEVGELELDAIQEDIIPASIIDSAAVAQRKKEIEERRRNSLQLNLNGEFLYGLAKFAPNDSVIQSYVLNQVMEGGISPAIILYALLEQDLNFDDPFIKRLIVVQYFYGIMKWDIERKDKK